MAAHSTLTETHFTLTPPTPYAFAQAVRDHGWVDLAPCRWDAATSSLLRVERLPDDRVVRLALRADGGRIDVRAQGAEALAPADVDHLRAALAWMLKLNEDLTPFYALAEVEHDGIWRTVHIGRGRLLRSPTLWEDVVKTICTTNITWSQTKSMARRLVDALGSPWPGDLTERAFPTPEQVLAGGMPIFAETVRMGYRNAYVLQLAEEVATGKRELEALRTAELPLAAMKKELLSIKGIGNYAAHTLLAILGYYGEIAVDTEYRNFVTRTHFGGETIPDRELATFYDRWGEWKYLAYWFDATHQSESDREQTA
jgi:3-methyladenine DNA glycosylase/8-oxoguanine DNA glycosylase